jgi:hypothetical protein
MCCDKIVCSPSHHPDLPQKGDEQEARTNLYDGITNSFSTKNPDLILSPTPAGDLSIVTRRECYSLARQDFSDLFVLGKTVSLMSGGLPDSGSWCTCHRNGCLVCDSPQRTGLHRPVGTTGTGRTGRSPGAYRQTGRD